MAFYGRSFIYDGVPSETYGLYISNIDANAINQSMASSSMDIKEEKIFRRPTPYFLGATPAPVLTFEFSAFSEEEIDADTFQLISKWLFSSRNFKKLMIDQEDIRNVYFNCIFVDPKIIRVGNVIKGFSATVRCDSPYAWRKAKNLVKSYSSFSVNDSFTFNNSSDDSGSYLYPSLGIMMNNFGGSISILNSEDGGRNFTFTGISPNEILYIDCDLQIIKSSLGINRVSNSNLKFFRLVPGLNHIILSGNIASFQMGTSFVAKKIAG